jgi:hypothetical protein
MNNLNLLLKLYLEKFIYNNFSILTHFKKIKYNLFLYLIIQFTFFDLLLFLIFHFEKF